MLRLVRPWSENEHQADGWQSLALGKQSGLGQQIPGGFLPPKSIGLEVDDEALAASASAEGAVGEALGRLHFADDRRPFIDRHSGDVGKLAPGCAGHDLKARVE